MPSLSLPHPRLVRTAIVPLFSHWANTILTHTVPVENKYQAKSTDMMEVGNNA